MAHLYYDSDSDPKLIEGKKVAIIGFGSQEMVANHGQKPKLKD